MSVEIEAFDAVRNAAYREWGRLARSERAKRESEILDRCRAQFRAWRQQSPEGGSLSDSQIEASSRSITQFILKRLADPSQKKRRKPNRTAEDRAWETNTIVNVMPELLKEDGEEPTITRVAQRMDVSRSRVARARLQCLQTPERKRAATRLSVNARKIVDCLDRVVPGDGLRVLTVASVAAAIWKAPASNATHRQHKKRLLALLQELSVIGYHVHIDQDLVALRRGRRFRADEAAAAINAVRAGRARPHGVPKWRAPGFWSTRIVIGLVSALEVALQPEALGEPMCNILALLGEVTDWRPIYRIMEWWERVVSMQMGLVEFLLKFDLRKSRRLQYDPLLAAALATTYKLLECLEHVGRWGWCAHDVIVTVVSTVRLRDRVNADEATLIDTLLWVLGRDRQADQLPEIYDALRLCRELAEIEERGGNWEARLRELYPPGPPVATVTIPTVKVSGFSAQKNILLPDGHLKLARSASSAAESKTVPVRRKTGDSFIERPSPLPPDPDCPF